MKEILNYLFKHNTLTQEESRALLKRMGQGEFSEPEIASFLTVFLMRKITPEELGGFREALLDLCVPVDLNGLNAIDVCGTGGDEKNTFNISTLTSFILAGAGVKVVKHGNYGVSSSCGSSNVLEHFGYKFSNNQNKLQKELDKANICYLHAPFFHPAMKHVGPVRKALKVKTFFNLLGPMVNPVKPKNQIVGVYNTEVQDLYNEVYKKLGINYCILYSLDGYDEISLTGDFRTLSNKGEKIYSPETINLKTVKPEDLFGGNSVEEAAAIFTNVLEAKATEAQTNAVLANAAFAFKTMDNSKSLEDCVAVARESIESKKALNVLKELIAIQ
ncbi:MAG: anthranilate phosphoribosyltransferase [Bacteroidales bacterium]|nr:anthranilate phosphoribosyltransferase [Bacteroidales bacterium]MBN2818078.1 anthranilate phosphoribosyltransferase [Bacteroidales bacterium]